MFYTKKSDSVLIAFKVISIFGVCQRHVLPGRLMAGHLVLVQAVGVRILPGQQLYKG